MIILGINEGHNASAALMVDGKFVAAVSEERISRRKNEYGYPERSINFCLEYANIRRNQIDKVAIASTSLPPKYFYIKRNATLNIKDYWREQKEYWYPRIYENKKIKYLDVFRDKIDEEGFIYDKSLIRDEDDSQGMLQARIKNIQSTLNVKREQVSVYDHHTCHAYFGYFANPDRTEDQLIYVADGFGDGANGTVWLANPNSPLKELARTNRCNIGRIYRYITLILGMKQNDHEYKVMGLAPYSNDSIGNDAYNVFAETLQVDGLNFKYNIQPKDHFFYFKEKLEGMRFDGIAYGLQKRTEELITEWISNGVRQTGVKNIIFCGGVAQNIKANKKVWEMDTVSNLYVPPASGDESLAFGAAYYEMAQCTAGEKHFTRKISPLDKMYLGKEYSDAEIKSILDSKAFQNGYSIQIATNGGIAELLSHGNIIARCCGRMEFGPRALGNRSIIADPRRDDVIRVINEMIKQRDFWMPFAPSILEERAADYLINPKKLKPSFMTIGFDTTELARKDLKGALHPYDYTVRPQIVSKTSNPDYHALLTAFENITGVGGVLNTSFNLHGEPIVESPLDALKTFEKTGLAYLVLGNWLVSKTRK